jgi:molybdate transport system substrate-binding protein
VQAIALLPLLAAASAGCAREPAPEERAPLVFAAASLADAMEEVGAAWERENPGTPVDFSFAGSNDLARQMAAGAPADLFVAADRARLEQAVAPAPDRARRIDLERAVALLGNELVVIVPTSATDVPAVASPRDLLAFDRIGLADPEAVPAGVYARGWLETAGVWDEIRPRVVPALDVRANLAAVASGSVPAGIVYATDAAGDAAGGLADRVRVIHHVPPGRASEGASPIVYWAAPVTGAAAMTERFLRFLAGPEAGAIFRRFGFRHLPTEDAGANRMDRDG